MPERLNFGLSYPDDDDDGGERQQQGERDQTLYHRGSDDDEDASDESLVDDLEKSLSEGLEHALESQAEGPLDLDPDDTRFGDQSRERRARKEDPWFSPDTRGLHAPIFVPLEKLPLETYLPLTRPESTEGMRPRG